jgi:hypothetical protein
MRAKTTAEPTPQRIHRRQERGLPGRHRDLDEPLEQTRKVLKTLTPREEKVLRMRFGIGQKSDHTLEEAGQHFEVTLRALSSDRGEGSAEAAAPFAQQAAEVVHRELTFFTAK